MFEALSKEDGTDEKVSAGMLLPSFREDEPNIHPSLQPVPQSPEQLNGQIESYLDNVAADFLLDNEYRLSHLSLTASENIPSKAVRMSGCALQGAFYYFPPPYDCDAGEWSFPESGAVRSLENKCVGLGRRLFESATFDWRPNGGSVAEQSILLGTCSRGDGFIHFSHRDGGHFALETLAQKIGVNVYHFPMEDRTRLIDVHGVEQMIKDHPEIKLVILDQSFKLRWQPLLQIRRILPETVFLSYDASHDGGLIAGGALPQPLLLGADAVHGSTHKTFAGPQKGYIAFKNRQHEKLKLVSDWVCPHFQSNSHAELLAPMTFALLELALYGRDYAQQVVANAKALAIALVDEGLNVFGESFGYTETQQVHVVLGNADQALAAVLGVLPKAGIRANNIEVPGTNGLYGLRLGTQALTRRGMQENEMKEVARFMCRALLKKERPEALRAEISSFSRTFPLDNLAFSLDPAMETPEGKRLIEEVLGWRLI